MKRQTMIQWFKNWWFTLRMQKTPDLSLSEAAVLLAGKLGEETFFIEEEWVRHSGHSLKTRFQVSLFKQKVLVSQTCAATLQDAVDSALVEWERA